MGWMDDRLLELVHQTINLSCSIKRFAPLLHTVVSNRPNARFSWSHTLQFTSSHAFYPPHPTSVPLRSPRPPPAMLSKMLTMVSFGLAVAIAILHADAVNALHQHHPPAHRHLIAKGPIAAHAHHPGRHSHPHHHKARHERKQVMHGKSKSTGARRLSESDYDDYDGYDDSSSDEYGHHYGRGYGRGCGDDDSSDSGDSYDDSSDYGNSYDDSSDYGYGPSPYGYGPSPYSYGGGGFGGYYPPFAYGGLESAASPVGSGGAWLGAGTESAVLPSGGGGAAPTSMTTTMESKKTAEVKKTEKKTEKKTTHGAK